MQPSSQLTWTSAVSGSVRLEASRKVDGWEKVRRRGAPPNLFIIFFVPGGIKVSVLAGAGRSASFSSLFTP